MPMMNYTGDPASGENSDKNMKPMFKKGRHPASEAAMMKKRMAGKCRKCGKMMKNCECEK